ncbi:MAG: glycine cleavage system aminomethyltransferase GcvT [Parvibaculales bacterium]
MDCMTETAETIKNHSTVQPSLNRTPLHELHVELGAKMVPFAGYEMPVQYPLGVMKEHLHTRAKAGLFDVSHMGQARLTPINPDDDAARLFEQLVPGGIMTLKEGRIRYTQLTDATGGILDDLMATRFGNTLWLVVNAACKDGDYAHIQNGLRGLAELDIADRGLLALQGPDASRVLSGFFPEVGDIAFMSALNVDWNGQALLVSRCGYTGEDGYEISLPKEHTEAFCRQLLADDAVEMIGLGARDSLRLEAGLCLYGHDIDTTTTAAQADLLWSVPTRRLQEANFPGAQTLNEQIAEGTGRKRVGILPEGRAPAREGTSILDGDGNAIGEITSGGFGPSVNGPVAMGYVADEFSKDGTRINLLVRGKSMPAQVATMPFVPHRYYRGSA